jgi:hypothetical protein
MISGDPMKRIVIVFKKGINTMSNLPVFLESSTLDCSEKK